MNAFERAFFNELEKIAVTAEEIRDANARVRANVGAVTTEDLKSVDLQGYLARSASSQLNGPHSLMGSLPIESVKAGPLKDDLVRRGHKRVMVTTPEHVTDDFVARHPYGGGRDKKDVEFFRDAVNFHETREAQQSRKAGVTLADFSLGKFSPKRARKVVKALGEGFHSHANPQIYLDDINQAITAGKSSRQAARLHGSDPAIQRQQREADLRAMQAAKDSGAKHWQLARDTSGPAAAARADKAALDAHQMGLGKAHLEAKLNAKRQGIRNYNKVRAGEEYQSSKDLFGPKVSFGDSDSAKLQRALEPAANPQMLNMRHSSGEVEDLPKALASRSDFFKDRRVAALLSGRDTDKKYTPESLTPERLPHYQPGQKIPKWLRKKVMKTWAETPLAEKLQTKGIPANKAESVAEALEKTPERAAAARRGLKILGVGAGLAAAGYGGYKLYKYLKNKKRAASRERASNPR